jgi:hypothetical protein
MGIIFPRHFLQSSEFKPTSTVVFAQSNVLPQKPKPKAPLLKIDFIQ